MDICTSQSITSRVPVPNITTPFTTLPSSISLAQVITIPISTLCISAAETHQLLMAGSQPLSAEYTKFVHSKSNTSGSDCVVSWLLLMKLERAAADCVLIARCDNVC